MKNQIRSVPQQENNVEKVEMGCLSCSYEKCFLLNERFFKFCHFQNFHTQLHKIP